MCVIYLLQAGTKGYKENGRFIVEKTDGTKDSIPLSEIESVIIGQHAQLTTQTVFEFLKRKVPLFYIGRDGKIVGSLASERNSLRLLQQQLNSFADEKICIVLAREIIGRKLAAQMAMLKYYRKRNKSNALLHAIKEIEKRFYMLNRIMDVDTLRGVEGIAAKNYFSVFGEIVLTPGWEWQGRQQHPAPDPLNALLSYGYWFLEREVRIALAGTELDCRIGFMHSNNGRKDSLVYDVMELFRQKIIDRFVLSLVNRKLISSDLFLIGEGRCFLTEEGKRKWIVAYEEYMCKALQEYGGKTPRQWIYREVKKFERLIKEIMREAEGKSKLSENGSGIVELTKNAETRYNKGKLEKS